MLRLWPAESARACVVSAADAAASYSPACQRRVYAVTPRMVLSRGCGGIVQPGVSTPGICGDASDGFKPRMRRHRIARRVNAGYMCQSGVPYVAPLGALTPLMRSRSDPGADAAGLYDSAALRLRARRLDRQRNRDYPTCLSRPTFHQPRLALPKYLRATRATWSSVKTANHAFRAIARNPDHCSCR